MLCSRVFYTSLTTPAEDNHQSHSQRTSQTPNGSEISSQPSYGGPPRLRILRIPLLGFLSTGKRPKFPELLHPDRN